MANFAADDIQRERSNTNSNKRRRRHVSPEAAPVKLVFHFNA